MHPALRHGIAALLLAPLAGFGQEAAPAAEPAAPAPLSIHVVYMGGNDCPGCVAWRATELPRLQASPVFKRIRFSMVTKLLRATVPPTFFLPDEVKPLKAMLDQANGGFGGSPQVAVVVNGELRDYYFGTRSAAQIERMVRSLERARPYPFTACMKLNKSGGCAEPVAQATAP